MPPLTAQQIAERKRRRGEAIAWTLLFLASLARVDATAFALARSLWTRRAPAAGRELFDATPVGANAAGRYRYNPDLVRYVAPNGRTIVPQAVKQQVTTFTVAVEADAVALTQTMLAGTLAVAEWQVQAAALVKATHVAAYVVGRGGLLATADVTPIESIVEYQLDKLLTYAKGVGDGSVSDAAATARLPLYIAGANGTFEAGHAGAWDGLRRTGVRIEMQNILQAGAEHCVAFSNLPGCTEETNRGWVPFGAMSTPGERACLSHCLCRLDYRRAR